MYALITFTIWRSKMTKHELKDTGKRQEFETGAVRDLGDEKGSYELVSPLALKRIALIYEKGCKKYSPRNWEKGMSVGRVLQSAIRHLEQYIEGYRDEDHLGQAAWNCMAAIHFEEMIERGLLPAELMDLPSYLPEGVISPEQLEEYIRNRKDNS